MSESILSKRVSSKDVAKEAGVSQSTVSRVFSDKAHLISDKTRLHVINIAKNLGYRPSMIARSLSTNVTKIIGIEMHDFSNAFYMKALGLFSKAFQDKGYNLMLFGSHNSYDFEEKLKMAMEYQVAGLILTHATLGDDYMSWCQKYHTPVFLFNRTSGEKHQFNSVVGDNYKGGLANGRLLVEKGYKKLAYIAGDDDAFTNHERERGFMVAVSEAGIDSVRIQGAFCYESGYDAAMIISEHHPTVDGVFCASDSIALGFIDGIKENTNLSIPEDLGVIGFDGIEEGANINYKLTTYQQPLETIVDRTVNLMIEKIEDQNYQCVQEVIPGDLIIRGTLK